MKCPYQDIGCWWIDDVSHECEARSRSNCPHEANKPAQQAKQEKGDRGCS
jgi:hypothetical protein